MWYNGYDGQHWKIGYATSNDGIIWNENVNNPILYPSEPWESSHISGPHINVINDKYNIWYQSGHVIPTSINFADSSDGVSWSKSENYNPVLITSLSGFDSTYISSPFVLKDGNEYKMWYSGYDGNHWSIGYATDNITIPSNVPLLKQTDAPWGNQEYDSASKWVNNNEQPTIGWWGCALTSAVMVLQHYGYNKLPDGTPLNPGTLNSWLKSQPDGYINGGWFNWLAIPRLTMLAKGINNITSQDALEFRWASEDKNLLTQDLNQNHPDILDEPGHFIVATAVDNNTFDINDPYYDRTELEHGYGNEFLSMRRYSPSFTDLSYLMISVTPDVHLVVKSSNGDEVGDQFVETPVTNPYSTSSGTIKPIKTYYLPQPENGDFTVILSSDNGAPYEMHIFVYDTSGNPKQIQKNGFVGNNSTDMFTIHIDKENLNNASINKNITFDSLLLELSEYYKLHKIKAPAYRSLTALIKNAKRSNQKHRVFIAKLTLTTTARLEQTVFKKFIDPDVYEIILGDITTLSNSL